MNINQLNNSIDVLKANLGDGLLSCDIWVSGTGQPIASYNGGNLKATALFDQITANIQKALKISEFAQLSPYYLFNIEGGTTIIVILVENLQWGIAVDKTKIQLGLLLNIAVPQGIASLKKAL